MEMLDENVHEIYWHIDISILASAMRLPCPFVKSYRQEQARHEVPFLMLKAVSTSGASPGNFVFLPLSPTSHRSFGNGTITRKSARKSIGATVQVCRPPEIGKSFPVLQYSYSTFIDRHGPDTTL